MTTSPGAASQTLPDPNQPVDLVPAHRRDPSAVGAASQEVAKVWTGTLLVGPMEFPEIRHSYTLVQTLSALDMVKLQEAQDGGKLREIIEAIGLLVVREERERLVEGQLLADPDDPRERMTIEDCIEVLSDGMEQITARPRNK